eukprot:TRINITY_DN6351_c0_g3_i1.p1 TRINITY_DN6351_c0_g3~~TRINITY_DN6351_c0_g3_i1.p1  ORF type:complete len:698 (+),score=250.79 TRINITY_DN6351_c0_g3_i1:126-2219(+)
MSGPRVARILTDLRGDIDAFLDPKVLATASREAAARGGLASSPGHAAETPPAAAPSAASPAAPGAGEAEDASEALRVLELAKAKAEAQRDAAELRAAQDAAALASTKKEVDDARSEGRELRRKFQEAESRLAEALAEAAALRRDVEESQERLEAEVAAGRAAEALSASKPASDSASAHAAVDEGMDVEPAASATTSSEAMLRERVAELESEIAELRHLHEGEPELAAEKELCAQLRARHLQNEEELQSARGQREQLVSLRQRLFDSEREEGSLRAALAARDAALKEAEKAVRGAAVARRDLGAFAAAAASIVADARATLGGAAHASDAAADAPDGAQQPPSPLDLSMAWARCQSELGSLRRERLDLKAQVDRAVTAQREAEAEAQRFSCDASSLRADCEKERQAARRASGEAAALKLRVEVLRSALARIDGGMETDASPAAAPATAEAEAAAASALDEARRRADDAEALAAARHAALEAANGELERLRASAAKLREAEAKTRELERVNGELWGDLERRRAAAGPSSNVVVGAGEAEGGCKILHFLRKPHEAAGYVAPTAEEKGSGEGVDALPSVDLERAQALRQLDRFKKATRKYVLEFREGIYGLLGWKVEMKASEGGAMRWHLTSALAEDGQELVFQLRPASEGAAANFDLLRSPWGEQLQEDRQAMAYLEVYRSVPGFLAHLTAELVAQKTMQG